MNDRARISLWSIFIALAMSVALASITFADGDSRKPSEAEKKFNKTTLEAIAKALPPAPAGWDKSGETERGAQLTEVYSEINQPMRVEYFIAWRDAKKIQASQIQLNEELIKLAKQPGFKGEGVEELQKKLAPQDVEARIKVMANLDSQSIYGKVTAAPAIGGGVVYRSQKALHIFLGKGWKTTGGGGTYVTYTPDRSNNSSTVVQNIAVTIQADPGRADRLAQSINWGALNGLIKK